MVCTLLSSSNSMTFYDFFHDLFTFFKTLGLAVTFKNFKDFPCLRVFLGVTQFNRHKHSGVNQNAYRSRCSVTSLHLTLSLPCHRQ